MKHPPDIDGLLTAIARQMPLLDAKREGTELYGAPRLNAFSLFNPNENTLSRVLLDLLDPRGSHGQGNLFLNTLLSALGKPKVAHTERVHVRREMPTEDGRRIDIIVETNDILLGIENKPWAKQLNNQLGHYWEELCRHAGGRQKNLVFLSNGKPETAKDDVDIVRFTDDSTGLSLRSILKDALDGVRSPRTQIHIQEFITYIDEKFGGKNMMNQGDEVYIEAVEVEFGKKDDGQKRRAAAAMMLSRDRLHEKILDEIGECFRSELSDLDGGKFVFEGGQSLYKALSGEKWENPLFIRRPSWPENLVLGVDTDTGFFKNVYFGVYAPNPDDNEVKQKGGKPCNADVYFKVKEVLQAVRGGITNSCWWPWYRYATTRNWTTEFSPKAVLDSPTGKVEDHQEIAEIAKNLVNLAECVDKALEGTDFK